MPIRPSTRGVKANQEMGASVAGRDIRTMPEKFKAWAMTGDGILMSGFTWAALLWVFPATTEIMFLLGMLYFRWLDKIELALPFKMPRSSGLMDHNDPDPASNNTKPSRADGIMFLGTDLETKRELWLKSDDVRTHFLIFGSTGAGKALRDDEKVLTPTGWVRMDSLIENDLIMSKDGRIGRVDGVYPQGVLPLWRVETIDGRRMDCSMDHLWEVHRLENGSSVEMRVVKTVELAALLASDSTWALPASGPIPMPEMPLDLSDHFELLTLRLGSGVELPDPRLGTLHQRERLFAKLERRFHPKRLASKTWWVMPTKAAAEWLRALALSLGHGARVLAGPSGWEVEVEHDQRYVPLAQVISTGEEASCRCIEVSLPDGLFLAGDGLVTHNTESLLSMAFNSLVQGSGFIYVDGKGDNSLWMKILSICRQMGREDDLLVINYMTGGRDVYGPQTSKLSNTMNPFTTGSAGGLTELLVGLMDEAGGDGAMWKGRAISMVSGIMAALVHMRNNDGFLLDVDQLRDYMILDNIQTLSKNRNFPPHILASIKGYLRSLPGYQEHAPKQSETVLDQHGYLQMQFTRILGSLSDTYGFIFRTNLGEVDFFDVVVNRRILCVLLPALEKSPDELGNLGKIIVASLKQMMATGLGNVLEGDYQDVLGVKPTNAPSPYMCILDEYGYYVVKGAAVMPAQARSLGFCMVFAGQDYPAFKKNNNAEEAVSTAGNCNIKAFMKLEDPNDTFNLCKDNIGEALASKAGGFKYETGIVGGYRDQLDASLDKRHRVDWLDLKHQLPGQAHMIFQSTFVRMQMFYANPFKLPKLQLNHFLRVEPPDPQDIYDMDALLQEMQEKLLHKELMEDYMHGTKTPARLAVADGGLDHFKASGLILPEAIMAAIGAAYQMSYQNANLTQKPAVNMAMGSSSPIVEDEEDDEEENLHIFSLEEDDEEEDDTDSDSEIDDEDKDDDDDAWSPLSREVTENRLQDMMMATGASPQQAKETSSSMSKEMQVMSSYPNPQHTPQEAHPDQLIEIIQELGEELD